MSEKIGVGAMDHDRFDRSKRLGWFDLDKMRRSKVTVIGCGALGNEVVKDLILSGFRSLRLIDMDIVKGSNMNRCLFFTEEDVRDGILKVEAVKRGALGLDDGLDVECHPNRIEDLDWEGIGGSDIIMGCLDNIGARIYVNSHARAEGVPYIDGATDGLIGKVQVVMDGGPCLECNMNRTHMRIMNLRKSCTGEDVSFFEPRLAGEITTTSIIAAIQVREAIKQVHGLKEKALVGVFYYDGMRNGSEVLEIKKNPRCPNHGGTMMVAVEDGSGKDRTEEVEKIG